VELCRTGSRASCPASGDIPLGESGTGILLAAQKQSLAEALLPTPLIGLSISGEPVGAAGGSASAFLFQSALSRRSPIFFRRNVFHARLLPTQALLCGINKARLGEGD
jgi:hypothetical protein